MSKTKIRNNPWPIVGKDILYRFCNIFLSVRFICFFIVGIVVTGAMGIWLPYVLSNDPNRIFFDSQNLFTFGMALLGTLFIDVLLDDESISDTAIAGIIFSVIFLGFSVCGFYMSQTGFSVITLIGAAGSMFVYLLSCVNDEKYENDDQRSDAGATGYKEANRNRIQDS